MVDDPAAQLADWRARGEDRADPVRFRVIEAMARRAQAHQGAARRVLDDRLHALLAAYREALARAPAAPRRAADATQRADAVRRADEVRRDDAVRRVDGVRRDAVPGRADAALRPTPLERGPLAALLDRLSPARPTAAAAGSAAIDTAAPGRAPAPPELKALSEFKATWSRLSADQRLKQSQAAVPGNAGPLNSQHLVHQALTLMRELSPAYLHRFMDHADALLWLDQAQPRNGAGR